MTTSKNSTPPASQLGLFAGDSPANRSASPGSEEARKMTVRSGRKCIELYKSAGPLGSLVKMLLASSHWGSNKAFLTWRQQAIKPNHSLFQLVPSTPRTDETESGYSLEDRLIPTPTARDWKDGTAQSCANVPANGLLGRVVHKLWPTPVVTDSFGARNKTSSRQEGSQHHSGTTMTDALVEAGDLQLQENEDGGNQVVGGMLSPMWVEWLMGYPEGWTDCGS